LWYKALKPVSCIAQQLAELCLQQQRRAVLRSKPPFQAGQVLLGDVTVLRLRLLVDRQGKSTIRIIRHMAMAYASSASAKLFLLILYQ
jgi:predicted lipid carrier protein YhbT